MPQTNPPSLPPPLAAANAARVPERPASETETLALHFLVGSAISTLTAAAWICSRPTRDYPATVAWGGLVVIAIQTGALWMAVAARQAYTRRRVQERHRTLTLLAGLACSAAVFALPPLVARSTPSDLATFIATVLPLIGGPLLAAFVVTKLVDCRAP